MKENWLQRLYRNISFKRRETDSIRRMHIRTAGTYINADTAMEISAYNSGLIYISTQIAKLPFEVKNSNNEVQYNSAINNLIDLAPNIEMNSFLFRLMAVQTAINWGNFYAEIERTPSGRPYALWPIHPLDMSPERTSDTKRLVYKLNYPNAKKQYLEPRDVFHIRNFHTKDGIVGMSLVDYAADVLGIAKGSNNFGSSVYANGAMPLGVLETEKAMKDDTIKKLKETWKELYGGRNVAEIAVLQDGLKFKPISMNPETLQFLQTKKFSVIEIARFLRVPPTKLFDTEASTYNNTENANLEVATDTLDPWCKNFETEVDIKLLDYRKGGLRSSMDLDAVFRGDMESRSKYFTSMFGIGSINSNEIRKKEGRPSYDSGDEFYIASNNYAPVSKIKEVIDAEIEAKKSKAKSDESVKKAIENNFNMN